MLGVQFQSRASAVDYVSFIDLSVGRVTTLLNPTASLSFEIIGLPNAVFIPHWRSTYAAPIVLVTFNACSPTLLPGFFLNYTRSDSNQSEWLDLNQHLLIVVESHHYKPPTS